MRIISIKKLKEFWCIYKDSEQYLKAWYAEAKKANWENPSDIKKYYKNASFIANNRAIFNIKGNKYRLIVAIKYEFKIVYIRFIGTHDEYDKINAGEI
jgi:mRNA interferase HigB